MRNRVIEAIYIALSLANAMVGVTFLSSLISNWNSVVAILYFIISVISIVLTANLLDENKK
jgi:predicted membrane channel-forming protein YqfA (hemolysin III family)